MVNSGKVWFSGAGNTSSVPSITIQFNIIYIMRSHMIFNQGQPQPHCNRHRPNPAPSDLSKPAIHKRLTAGHEAALI